MKLTHEEETLNNIETKLTDGNQKTIMTGNDGNNGAGNNTIIKTDSDGVLQVHSTLQDIRLGNIDNKLNSDSAGALIVRLDNSNDSVRVVGQNSTGSNKGIGVEDTDGAILGGAKVLTTDPTSSNGSRQVLRMNTKNELMVSNFSRGSHTNFLNSITLGAGALSNDYIDLDGFKGIVVYGNLTGSHSFYLAGSGDNSTYYYDGSNSIYPDGNNYEFMKSFTNLPRYIKIKNSNTSNTFTLNYQLFK
jgi:hypothetical protein